ncbi:MAG: hypothetical protein R3E53_06165 [Myxococcota bacterium]
MVARDREQHVVVRGSGIEAAGGLERGDGPTEILQSDLAATDRPLDLRVRGWLRLDGAQLRERRLAPTLLREIEGDATARIVRRRRLDRPRRRRGSQAAHHDEEGDV